MELSQRLRKIKVKYNISEKDIMYCDLVNAGWNKTEAAFFALNLAYGNDSRVATFMREHIANHPGITDYLNDLQQESDAAAIRKERLLTAEKKKQASIEDQKRLSSEGFDLRTKEGMLEQLITLAERSSLDPKTKADLLKQITDLMGYKKEEIKEQDNRIHFYLPLTCCKCSLYIQNREKSAQHNQTIPNI